MRNSETQYNIVLVTINLVKYCYPGCVRTNDIETASDVGWCNPCQPIKSVGTD